jgi:hypothetical protein
MNGLVVFVCAAKLYFKKKFDFFSFKLIFYVFLYHFNMVVSKIKKNIILIYLLYHNFKHAFYLWQDVECVWVLSVFVKVIYDIFVRIFLIENMLKIYFLL